LRRSSAARALLGAVLACALAPGAAWGAEPHPHVGRLPGFPAIRGVVPVLGSEAAVSARERLVDEAFAAARARHAKGSTGALERNEGALPECEDEALFFASQDVCYRGGPVLRDPTLHLIFWQGPVEEDKSKEANVDLFPLGYLETVKRYFEDAAHDSGAQTNVFAVDPQYGDTTGPGRYALAFDGASDVAVDNTAFPKHTTSECSDESEYARGPCLLDADIQGEVQKVAETSEKGLHDIYLVLTPPGVTGCFEEASRECAYKQYCAYHGDFGGDGATPGTQTLYADLPFVGADQPFTGAASGCDSGIQPNAGAVGADGLIDDASHELNETITDPIGSQCKSVAKEECERNAWTDVIGQEIADKCLPPESTVAGVYGEPLGEVTPGEAASAFNQLINGDRYFTQREWSNEAGLFDGGCVQRPIGASFSVPQGAAATVPATLDGSASGASGDPAVYWVWSFEEGEQVGSASPRIAHTFARAGAQEVGLTAYDAYGNAEGRVEQIDVGPAPPPPPPPLVSTPPAPREASSTPAHFTAAQIAAKLGLPANGRKLAGGGAIALGRAECPPACVVTLRLYAKVRRGSGKHPVTRLVPVGAARIQGVPRGAVFLRFQPGSLGELSLSLNATGRALLRKTHTLVCTLIVKVEGQEGGTWRIARSLRLTAGGRAARG
jgi:PKD domain-containing protein